MLAIRFSSALHRTCPRASMSLPLLVAATVLASPGRSLSYQPAPNSAFHTTSRGKPQHVLVIPKILLLVEQIGPGAAQIDNLRTPIAVLFQARALETVEGVADALAAAHDALVLVVAERALVADAREGCRAHVRVAHGAFAVAFVAESADGDAGLFAAHDKVAGGVSELCGERGGGGGLTDDGETWWVVGFVVD
jgi:hypothetical protein